MLDQYANMLVREAVNLRPGQDLFIRGPAPLHDFGLLVGEAAYHAGAGSVHYRFPDPDEIEQILRIGSTEQITIYHEGVQECYAEIIKRGAASIALVHHTQGEPWWQKIKQHCPDNFRFYIHGMSKLHMAFFDQYLRRRRFPHTTAPVATDVWAKQVFSDAPNPLQSLWQIILYAADGFKKRRETLEKRRTTLDSLEIRELHITGGGNDLWLTLSDRERWQHALVETRNGQASYCNFPSDEIFTVPDCRVTRGKLVASKPLRLFNREWVEDLSLEFCDGQVVAFEATVGKESFGSWINLDSGASLVGEIGLVGNDAPLYGIDRYFDLPQFDENTASHIALGHGLAFALKDSGPLSEKALAALGCNTSAIHTDICFGSPEVSIVATKTKQGTVTLLDGGEWGV